MTRLDHQVTLIGLSQFCLLLQGLSLNLLPEPGLFPSFG